jgi:hypothetical protein
VVQFVKLDSRPDVPIVNISLTRSILNSNFLFLLDARFHNIAKRPPVPIVYRDPFMSAHVFLEGGIDQRLIPPGVCERGHWFLKTEGEYT